MASILPIQDSPFFSQLIDLDDATYSITIRWNDREEAWYLDINEQDKTPILSDLKLISFGNLTGRWADSRLPSGDIFVFGPDINVRPDRQSLVNETVQLVYLTPEEVESVNSV